MSEQEAFESFIAKWNAEKKDAGLTMTDDEHDCAEEAWHAALAWLHSQSKPVARVGINEPYLIVPYPESGGYGANLYPNPQPAIPDGHVIAPAFRGYAVMGAGEYMLDCCPPDEYGPSLIISIATEDEKAGRAVGDLRDPIPGKLIQPEVMAIRIDFLTVAGLDALEQQLRILRADYFTAPEPSK